MRHPLASSPRHWPEEARAFYEERCGLIADGCRVSREESERRAEEVTRAWWAREPS